LGGCDGRGEREGMWQGTGSLEMMDYSICSAEGAIAGDKPGNAADIRLISGGRFIEDGVSVQGEVIASYLPVMGESRGKK
jgi:hypothetical protein